MAPRSKQARVAALQSAPPKHGSERGHPTPMGWLTRGDHTVPRCSVIGADSWWDLGGCLGRHKRGPPSGSACSSPRFRCDVPSFGPAVGEPLAGPHVTQTWPLGWAVGSIAGHALKSFRPSSGGARRTGCGRTGTRTGRAYFRHLPEPPWALSEVG